MSSSDISDAGCTPVLIVGVSMIVQAGRVICITMTDPIY